MRVQGTWIFPTLYMTPYYHYSSKVPISFVIFLLHTVNNGSDNLVCEDNYNYEKYLISEKFAIVIIVKIHKNIISNNKMLFIIKV